MTTTTAAKADLLRSLHVPGEPLIVTNVWDAVTARIVAGAPGVRALATASHAVSFARGVADGEGLTVDQALETAHIVTSAVDLPVSVDFERGYAADLAGLEANIARLVDAGAAGLNIEDSTGPNAGELRPLDEAADRVAAVRHSSAAAGVPLVINARVDALVRGASFDDAVARANAYLGAGADVVFVLGLGTEELVSAPSPRSTARCRWSRTRRRCRSGASPTSGSRASASAPASSGSPSPTCRRRPPSSPRSATTPPNWGLSTEPFRTAAARA